MGTRPAKQSSLDCDFDLIDDVLHNGSLHVDDIDPSEVETASQVILDVSDRSGDDRVEQYQEIISTESKYIQRYKVLVFLAIVLAAVAGGICAYWLEHDQQQEHFDAEGEMLANEIGDNAMQRMNDTLSGLQSLSSTITALAMSEDIDFPFVTLPYFNVQTEQIRNSQKLDVVGFAPLVYANQTGLWESYSVAHQGWVRQGLSNVSDAEPIPEHIYRMSSQVDANTDALVNYSLPIWQVARVTTDTSVVNLDLASAPTLIKGIIESIQSKRSSLVIGGNLSFLVDYHPDQGIWNASLGLFQPVFASFERDAEVVGVVFAAASLDRVIFSDSRHAAVETEVLIRDQCGHSLAFDVGRSGISSQVFAVNAYHGFTYSGVLTTSASVEMTDATNDSRNGPAATMGERQCDCVLEVYSTRALEAPFSSYTGMALAWVVLAALVAVLCILLIYDRIVVQRQKELIRSAAKSVALASSLFPQSVQERMMAEVVSQPNSKAESSPASGTPGILAEHNTKPIADLFPNATVLFADIVGFTAWCSSRDPSKVFSLLETIYHAFDESAHRLGVFKVETIGDCYVAVTGIPRPQADHAVRMCSFGRIVIGKFQQLVKDMELTMGPDTSDLGIRVGIHSGPVTAGVLRGERSRFQLFGDTVNTTARLESSGMRNKVHVSQSTADLLEEVGKGHWVRPRSDQILAKGKGELTTYWLTLNIGGGSLRGLDPHENTQSESPSSRLHSDDQPSTATTAALTSEKKSRLVQWNVDLLCRLLRKIVAQRIDSGIKVAKLANRKAVRALERESMKGYRGTGTVLEEVVEIIKLPDVSKSRSSIGTDPESVVLPEEAVTQLHNFVQSIANMYHDNPFHNFEHASHVTMSVHKLLCRIVEPESGKGSSNPRSKAATLHQSTYGISSDPLTQFAVVLSALLHDVDHPGVPNSTLVNEKSKLADAYGNKSVAEQNSVDLAWDLLMDDSFESFRNVLYSTEAEFARFRKLLVNIILATDIMDKELGAFRKARWSKAFDESIDNDRHESFPAVADEAIHRKATIVLEHLIQASDVVHTMQHWHIYSKWNERLFSEMYNAFTEGRSKENPADNWYEGEIGFFDFYVIPLARKLESCGVFGVSSDEYLNYAETNRRKWAAEGKEIVQRYKDKYVNADELAAAIRNNWSRLRKKVPNFLHNIDESA